jgi:hypothetical protein
MWRAKRSVVMSGSKTHERDRRANFASRVVAAGLNERNVGFAEVHGSGVAGAIEAIPDRLDLPPGGGSSRT